MLGIDGEVAEPTFGAQRRNAGMSVLRWNSLSTQRRTASRSRHIVENW
jgi:hypothetical protein